MNGFSEHEIVKKKYIYHTLLWLFDFFISKGVKDDAKYDKMVLVNFGRFYIYIFYKGQI